MGKDHVENLYPGIRRQRGAVFMDSHGVDQVRSVSVSPTNRAAAPASYLEIPEGQVLAYHKPTDLYYPVAADSLQTAAAATNDLDIDDPYQFKAGDVVNVDGVGYRTVTAVDNDAGTITVDGAAITADAGTAVESDPGESYTTVATTAAAPGGATTIEVEDASGFEVGDTIDVAGDTGTVTAVDTAADPDTITIAEDIAVTAGDLVVSTSDGNYKLAAETVHTADYRHDHSNVLVPTRQHGEVKERLVLGLTTAAKTALEPMITFNPTTQ